MDIWAPRDTSGELRGRALRYLLVKVLQEAGRPLTVRELVTCCIDEGVVFVGRPSKIVSDALRWERRSGRVRHVRRGVYAFGEVPRSTMRWISHRVEQTRYWLAWTKTQPDPPAPTSREPWVWDPTSWVRDWPLWHSPN